MPEPYQIGNILDWLGKSRRTTLKRFDAQSSEIDLLVKNVRQWVEPERMDKTGR